MKIIAISILMLTLLSFAVAAKPSAFCTDTDGGISIYTPGTVTSDKGTFYDDCDGSSENLKEFYCDDKKDAHENVKCSDYGAFCITRQGPDSCECPIGTVFNEQSQMCIDETPNHIPEFSTVAAGIALAGSSIGYILLRRN